MMEYTALPVGSFGTNCYLAWCDRTQAGIVIDPGAQPGEILKQVEELSLDIKAVVNTHGHLDHIGGNGAIASRHNCPVFIGAADARMLEDPQLNYSARLGKPVTSPAAQRLLSDGDQVEFGRCALAVLSTPGHTPGSICLLGHGVLFSGDTLFAGSVGRTDLPGGSHNQLVDSIRRRLLPLPDEIAVLPGHGPATTIGQERQNNPWLQG